MAEAIGAASGILTFAAASIGVTVTIIDLISGFKDAPQTITDLHDNLCILKGILEQLSSKEQLLKSQRENGETQNPGRETLGDVTRAVVEQCSKVLRRISDVLAPLQENLTKGKAKANWTKLYTSAMDKTIQGYFGQLERSKSNLVLALTFDARFAVINKTTGAETHSLPTNDNSYDPPEYFEVNTISEVRRKNSEIDQMAQCSKPIASQFSMVEKTNGDLGPGDISGPGFKDLVAATIDNLNKSMAQSRDGKESSSGYCLAVLNMIWRSDVEKIRVLQNSSPEAVKHLKEGKTGSGKSVLTKTVWKKLTDARTSASNPRDTIVLSYSCNNRMRPSESCTSIVPAFIYQYLRENKSEFSELVDACEPLRHDWDPLNANRFPFNLEVVMDIFMAILRISAKKTVYCIVDAIDECRRDDGEPEDHESEMEKFINWLPKLITNHSGTVVKFFISTRPDWIKDLAVDFSLASVNPIKLKLKTDITKYDISILVEHELSKLETRFTLSPEDKMQLQERLVERADGMILWVVLAFRDLSRKIKRKLIVTLTWVNEVVDAFPREIFGMYNHIMDTIDKRYSDEAEEGENESDLIFLRRLLLWVANAGRILTMRELQVVLAVEMSDEWFRDVSNRAVPDLENVISRVPFLEILDENQMWGLKVRASITLGYMQPFRPLTIAPGVRFIHQTAKEYVLQASDPSRGTNQPTFPLNSSWPTINDHNIGKLCIQFLSMKDFSRGFVRNFPPGIRFTDGLRKLIDEYGFLAYTATFWFYHIKKVPDLDDETKALITAWSCDLKDNARFWQQVMQFVISYGLTSGIKDGFFGLHIMAWCGVESMVKHLIERGEDVNSRDEEGGTPYSCSLVRKNRSIKELLTKSGADTSLKPKSWSGYMRAGSLQSIVYSDNMQKLKQRIDEGCDIEETNIYGQTPLFTACARGATECAKLLLDSGASLTARDIYSRLPIDIALVPDATSTASSKFSIFVKLAGTMEDGVFILLIYLAGVSLQASLYRG
ncbi:hypothetical protein ABW19_dt0206747 [Dactylella cylindrospora]|nr:hypothetical protein ABW19_dt0206747 [Dactylella cylindrospora]